MANGPKQRFNGERDIYWSRLHAQYIAFFFIDGRGIHSERCLGPLTEVLLLPPGDSGCYRRLSSVDRDLARELVDAAHGICPYSKATRGNIDVKITLV